MQMPSEPSRDANSLALYRATLEEAAAAGEFLMGKLVESARQSLQSREAASRDFRERDALALSAKQLRQFETQLCQGYPDALRKAFASSVTPKVVAPVQSIDLHFDQLELMDESQVVSSVALARLQQSALLEAETSLAELNPLICSTLGLGAVKPERNPLRPEIYIGALREVVEQTRVPTPVQLDWIGSMSVALGKELKMLYATVSQGLRSRGVVAAHYVVTQKVLSEGVGRGVAQWERGADQALNSGVSAGEQSVLNLESLRQLLSGEMEPGKPQSRMEQFAQQFSQQFDAGERWNEAPAGDFDATVPAALEALSEMKQVKRVVQSLEQWHERGQTNRADTQGHIQALSREVVTLMVDNIARDPRLLAPVHRIIRRMEPALLQLALVDPRFFSDKQHPARELLQAITHRSLAYESVISTGFDAFVDQIEVAITPLLNQDIRDAQPFLGALRGLQQLWDRTDLDARQAYEAAIGMLQRAETRNLLAEKVARSIEADPNTADVPEVVMDFLCGPWAQVIAQARIGGGATAAAAAKYQALVSALLWSAHPQLARNNVSKLTRLVPRLLGTLREGLDSVEYPATRTSAFFEALMGIYQRVFRSENAIAAPTGSAQRDHVIKDGDPWVAPQEAKHSNFMEIAAEPAPANLADAKAAAPLAPEHPGLESVLDELPLGSWIELQVAERWVRTQLTWASPQGTLFLFTDSFGSTKSMSRRSRDKLLATGQLRLISGQPLVDHALDAVVQVAMQNSIQSKL
jgi:hypothetical protein